MENLKQKIVNKKYELLAKIASSDGSAAIYKAIDIQERKEVAIKHFIQVASNVQEVQKTLNEFKRVSSLNHDNIVKFIECFQEFGCMYLVMEYCEERDMRALINSCNKNSIFISVERIFKYFLGILNGLEFIHSEKIIHRDIKPDNIFLKNDIPKLGDFGVSRELDESSNAYTIIGTGNYMSPECLQKLGYTFKTDIWSLACVIYELVTLRAAFTAKSYFALQDQIVNGKPPELETNFCLRSILNKMFSKNPELRPSSKDLKSQVIEIYSETIARERKIAQSLNSLNKSNTQTLYDGRFSLIKNLGDSSESIKTFLVEDTSNSDRRVIQLIKNNVNNQEKKDGLDNLKKISQINSNLFVKYHGNFSDSNRLFLVFDYCSFGSLSDFIRRHDEKDRINAKVILQIFTNISRAIQKLHDLKILHKNLKPTNIFYDENQIKIGDISFKNTTDESITISRSNFPYYQSPDILQNTDRLGYTIESDLWSIGCIVYELIILKKPFHGRGIAPLVNSIVKEEPSEIDNLEKVFNEKIQHDIIFKLKPIIKKLLAKKRFERGKLSDIINELEDLFKQFTNETINN